MCVIAIIAWGGILVTKNSVANDDIKNSVANDDIIGTWEGTSRMMHVVLHETVTFEKNRRGHFTVNEDAVYFTWKRIDSSTIEAYTDDGTQVYKYVDGRLEAISANGMPTTVYNKR